MLKLDTVEKDILSWITNFVEVPHPALGGWAPCPYARKARMDRDYEVRVGLALMHDLIQLSRSGLRGKSVVIVAYELAHHTPDEFDHIIDTANQKFLLPAGLLALGDHPSDTEVVNGVVMNQGTYALVLVQNLEDLDKKASSIAQKGFYDTWPAEYVEILFKYRKDPRQI